MIFNKYNPQEMDQISKELKKTLDEIVEGQEYMQQLTEQIEKTGNTEVILSAIETFKEQAELMEKLSKQSKQLSKQIRLAAKDLERNMKLYNLLDGLI